MFAKHIQPGVVIDYKNTKDTAIYAGDIVVIGTKAGVAAADIQPGDIGSVMIEEVFEVPKDNAAISLGAKVYYDAENNKATATEAGNASLGFAVADAAAGDAAVRVKLG